MLSNHLLSCHKKLKSTGFATEKLIQNKRQTSKLLRLLTRAKFIKKIFGLFNCLKKRCKCCKHLERPL